jgi:hypothetical protein
MLNPSFRIVEVGQTLEKIHGGKTPGKRAVLLNVPRVAQVTDNVRTLSDPQAVLEACLIPITSQAACNLSVPVSSFNETSLSVHLYIPVEHFTTQIRSDTFSHNDSPSAVRFYPSSLQMESFEGKSSTCSMIQQALKA